MISAKLVHKCNVTPRRVTTRTEADSNLLRTAQKKKETIRLSEPALRKTVNGNTKMKMNRQSLLIDLLMTIKGYNDLSELDSSLVFEIC